MGGEGGGRRRGVGVGGMGGRRDFILTQLCLSAWLRRLVVFAIKTILAQHIGAKEGRQPLENTVGGFTVPCSIYFPCVHRHWECVSSLR